ncbi:MAG: class 1 fructose-bisphosphatase [Gemmatimonadales bacterium]|nr:MAG: class 1 fructose-bisphosphatase [Gemmatimonadales bacterium]
MNDTHIITIERHIIEEERRHPEARGAFSNVLSDLALAAKVISRQVNMAGLVDILGRAGHRNVQGEDVQKLDVFAQDVIWRAMDHTGHLCCMASEEVEEFMPIPDKFPAGDYVLLFDPLDGSSNIDVNVSIGTIFSIHRKVSKSERGAEEDCLQPGHRQMAAGYVLYGSSTMMVYTTGEGVHGFTLDPSIGEFILSHENIRIPDPPSRYYSVNEAYFSRWTPEMQAHVARLKDPDREEGGFSSRYIGSLVADAHRTLMRGGLFMYPGDRLNPRGKLRLQYEANPLAFIVEQAGGRASDGRTRILDREPDHLHERIPLFLGSDSMVRDVEAALGKMGGFGPGAGVYGR